MSTANAGARPVPPKTGPRAPPVGRLASLKSSHPTPIKRPQAPARPQGPKPPTHPKTNTCPNPSCPAPNIVEDEGQKVCSGCGTVISEANIVSEVTFGETASGAAIVQGTFVGADQTHTRSYGPGYQRGGGMESREITEQNGTPSPRVALPPSTTKNRILTMIQVIDTSSSSPVRCTFQKAPQRQLVKSLSLLWD